MGRAPLIGYTVAVFTQAELDHLCRTPRQRMLDAYRAGDVVRTFHAMAVLIRDITALYARWSAVTVLWLHERHGLDAAACAMPPHELLPFGAPALGRFARDVLVDSGNAAADALDAAAKAGEAAVLSCWNDIHAECYSAETVRRDTLTALLTLVNNAYGADGLDDCLRYATDLIWVPRMQADLAQLPDVRLRSWAEKMAVGHNGGISIVEEPSRWVLTLDPCGSCGRQVLDGRFAPPWNFGVVADGHAVGFLRSDITVYQAHLAIAHTLVPIERTGAPWPAMRCAGLVGRPCELVIYKSSSDTDARYFEQVGANVRAV